MCSSTGCARRWTRISRKTDPDHPRSRLCPQTRLNAWAAVSLFVWACGYAALFTLSAAILFGLLYLLLASALQRKDREIIEARLRECARSMTAAASRALQDLVQRSGESDKDRSFFVRLAGQRGSVAVADCPRRLGSVRYLRAGPWRRPVPTLWLRIPKDEERDFTIAAMRLPDGRSSRSAVALTIARCSSGHFAVTS